MKIVDYCLDSYGEQSISELAIYQCGYEKCSSDHCYGYSIRDHYLIHYIVSGSGEYHVNGKTYHLTKGDGFMICPSVSTMYKSCPDDPWEYYWVGFYGTEAKQLFKTANIGPNNLIFHNEDKEVLRLMKRMYYSYKKPNSPKTEALGYLYIFVSKLIEQCESLNLNNNNNSTGYVEKAINYIKCNYSHDLSIQEIADFVEIDRSHLFRLFKLHTDLSPQQYIINCRLSKARELLQTTDFTVEEIAHSVGFEYLSYFFRIFKKETKLTPLQYKKSISGDSDNH